MLRNIVPRECKETVNYKRNFFYENYCGCSFDCDENGNVVLDNDAAKENYEYAINNPDKFPYAYNEFSKEITIYIEPAHGTCDCGNEVYLENEYCGACQCNKCGQWYNLFGQEILPPEMWKE